MSKQLFDIDTFRAQPLPSEEEVMASWQGDIENPVVSILCNTFNQKMYIEDAFRGFLIQKTDFVFEVIVHDDASTDGTSDIVREYAKRYPKIFKPVIQTENKYSKGRKITSISASHAKGKFCALCEGDDFWIDENKLQKQYELLVGNPESKICFTPVYLLSDEMITGVDALHADVECTISLDDVICGGGPFIPTPSIFIHSDIIQNIPLWFEDAPVGDLYLQILGASPNGALFIPDVTAVYRTFSEGSWNSARKKFNENKIIKDAKAHERCLTALIQMQPSYKNSLDFVRARQSYLAAYSLMSLGRYQLARKFITKSWEIKPKVNKAQVLLFRLRMFLPLIRLALITKSKLAS
ncbi:glycosyltransferase family 2 protein [Pseudoalteromonas nigrifaciens]|uniref:glycosyltransferase family 2 protein n=1 Tax=Pseudoalteromonas nigrifaciens TaxID=28109 RepID=UPI001787F4B9|nr:glycosyltransferase family A protein [Pseudoalteromonas nigrifaciens]MBE0421903.1 glycosyltransferase family 2 protein [Pseudoalteromonas nigrifaciens]